MFRLRIDCALVPFLSADAELGRDAVRLERFGVFECEAGAALAAVTVDGRVGPCCFAAPTQPDIRRSTSEGIRTLAFRAPFA